MKKYIIATALAGSLFTSALFAQKNITVPKAVKTAFAQKYPGAKHVTWEAEKGNYEANWGGREGEDNSVLYSPAGRFIEAGKAIAVTQLPASVVRYVKSHYKGAAITEAMLVTDANGKITYEAEVHGKDVVFDQEGTFVKTEK